LEGNKAITMVLKMGPNEEMKRVVILAVGSSGGIFILFYFF